MPRFLRSLAAASEKKLARGLLPLQYQYMDMFSGYDSGKFFDEMFNETGSVRDHCAPLLQKLGMLDQREFLAKKANSELYFLRQGITFNVYHDDQGTERIFPFDPVPRVIPAHEWELLEAGLSQRLMALNLFLHDIYHEQHILKDGIIPRHYIENAKHYRPEFRGNNVPKDIYIHICGSDLVRGHDGTYYVLEDNGRCPSGASYLLENRNALKRAFPGLFDTLGVRSVDSYPRDLLDMLHYISPRPSDDPVCVLLTPGCHNSAYFEHCYLARELGIEIVEGRDLVVVDNVVFMRTTTGLVRVDVIYRRIDDDFLDPTVFRKDSVLGVPGLMNAYRAGNVALANAVGTGVADDKVIYYFVPKIIEYYRLSSMKSTRSASPCPSFRRKRYFGWRKKPSNDSTLSSSSGPSYTLPARLMRTLPRARARSSGW